jgi:hypothetical protein
MNFRIRYRHSGLSEVETVVEANSPTEAVVKFRCMRQGAPSVSGRSDEVLSVSAVDMGDQWSW